jgi:hypothetical protein
VTITLTNDTEEGGPALGSRRPQWRRYVGAGLVAVGALGAVGVVLAYSGASSSAPSRGSGTGSSVSAHLVNGIPVGYPRAEAGARAAAVNYRVAWGSTRLFNPDQRRQLIEATTDPATRTGSQGQNDATWVDIDRNLGLSTEGQPASGQTLVCRLAPAGAMTVAYSPDQAVIAVWSSGLFGIVGSGSQRPLRDGWETATITLRWVNGDWKQTNSSIVQGPTPRPGTNTPADESAISTAAAQYGALSYAG